MPFFTAHDLERLVTSVNQQLGRVKYRNIKANVLHCIGRYRNTCIYGHGKGQGLKDRLAYAMHETMINTDVVPPARQSADVPAAKVPVRLFLC